MITQGCRFEWNLAHTVPTIITPDGIDVFVRCEGNCPYISDTSYPTGSAAAAGVTSDEETFGDCSVHLGDDPEAEVSEGECMPPPPVPDFPDVRSDTEGDRGNYDEPPPEDVDIPTKDRDPFSTQHQLTHFPYNPKCDVCVRANKRRKIHRRNKGKDHELVATKFGDVITMDFLSNHKERVEGLLHQTEGLVVYDLYTQWLHIYPLTGRTALQVSMCIQKFLGIAKCRVCYSDRAPELVSGIKAWGIPHEKSLPGKPQTDGLIEQCVGRIARGARALLQASGQPQGF